MESPACFKGMVSDAVYNLLAGDRTVGPANGPAS